jgi:amphi-Trp domain-containing protein
MGEKSELFHCDSKLLTYDAAIVLEGLVAGLRQGKLSATGENGPVCVELPPLAKLEIRFKEKAKPGKSKRKLSIELTWKEGEEIGLDG